MRAKKLSGRGRRLQWIATATAVLLIFVGMGLVAAALAWQHNTPQGPVAAGGSGAVKWGVLPESSQPPDTAAAGPSTNVSPSRIGSTLHRSRPVFINIPSIGVHSVVQHLGQTEEGALEVPAPGPHYNEAAWYRHSPTPGSLGPAIVYGHVDSAIDGPSVFFRLGELQPGDRISISRADDSTAVFRVDDVHRYAKDNFPTDVVYSDINHAGLRILTCGGAFDDAAGHYLDNIVVFASLVESHGEPADSQASLGFGFFGFASYEFDPGLAVLPIHRIGEKTGL